MTDCRIVCGKYNRNSYLSASRTTRSIKIKNKSSRVEWMYSLHLTFRGSVMDWIEIRRFVGWLLRTVVRRNVWLSGVSTATQLACKSSNGQNRLWLRLFIYISTVESSGTIILNNIVVVQVSYNTFTYVIIFEKKTVQDCHFS